MIIYNIFDYVKSHKFVIIIVIIFIFDYFIIFHLFFFYFELQQFSIFRCIYSFIFLFIYFFHSSVFCTFSRDLKPENLLLNSVEDDANVKIADFGFAVECSDSSLTTRCGTPGTFLQRKKKNSGKTQILKPFRTFFVNLS